jgi:hypothetical protein
MKKIMMFFCLLFVFAAKILAQNTGYDDCVKNARYADGVWTTESTKSNYLIRTTDKKILGNIVLKNKLLEIRNIFFKAYPTPKAVVGDCWINEGNSHGYGNSIPKMIDNSPEPFHIGTWFSALKCDKNGMLIKKLGEELPDYSFQIYINTCPHGNRGISWDVPYLTDSIDKVKYKKFEKIYCIPPHDNFGLEDKRRGTGPKNLNYNLNNTAEKYFVFRYKTDLYGNATTGYVDKYYEKVIMTYNNKLPYMPLTKGELFQILELYILQYSKDQNSYMHQKNQDESNIKSAQKIIAANAGKIEKIKELVSYFKETINEPATVTDYYKNNSFIIDDLDKPQIKNMFITDAKKGYTYSRPDPTFFKSNKIEDIQLLSIEWTSKRRNGGDPNKQTAEDKLPLVDYGLTNAMEVFDWDKLASLMMKQ